MNHEAAGWHGKLPTVSDFASRRLDARFIELWDSRLSDSIEKMRLQDEEGWVAIYLASPTWRFLISRGFLPPPFDASAWAGVLMPSVDRVGRYYPLTLVSPLIAMPTSLDSRKHLWSWLERLEDASVNALQEDWQIDELEAELFRIGLPSSQSDCVDSSAMEQLDEAVTPSFAAFFNFGLGGDSRSDSESSGSCVWYGQVDMEEPRVLQPKRFDEIFQELWTGCQRRLNIDPPAVFQPVRNRLQPIT